MIVEAPEAVPARARRRRDRVAAGVARRGDVPRQAHAAWKAPPGRRDPVAILEEQGADRIPALLPVRYARMRLSPFAFLRGAAAVMAADLACTPVSGLFAQSCGDAHLANFGSFETQGGVPVLDVNDFDETLRAPFEWDVKRLATSLVLAGREQGLGRPASARLARASARAYATEMARLSRLSPIAIWNARVDLRDAIAAIPGRSARAALQARLNARSRGARTQFDLLDLSGERPRLREKPPLVVRLPEGEAATHEAFARYVESQPSDRAALLARYRLHDVMVKVVGVGSVGTFCAIGLFLSPDDEPLLLQIKEAQRSVLEPYLAPSPFADAGRRVVEGQRLMQALPDPFLGWTQDAPSGPEAANGPGRTRQFYVRLLKDSRLAAFGSQIEADALEAYGALCGRVLGRAHARSADAAAIAGYLGRGRAFAEAIGAFALAYAEQTERDWVALNGAIVAGRIAASAAPSSVLSF